MMMTLNIVLVRIGPTPPKSHNIQNDAVDSLRMPCGAVTKRPDHQAHDHAIVRKKNVETG
jgi:hypothetical protein